MGKSVILVHGDSDGVCSGSIIKAYLALRGEPAEVFFSHPAGLLQDLGQFTSDGDSIYIADIALDEATLSGVLQLMERRGKTGRVVYIDHHPLPDGFSPPPSVEFHHDTCCAASELTFRVFGQRLDRDMSRVALFGAIGDYIDDTPWVKSELSKWDKRSVYYEAGVLAQGLEHARKEYDFKRKVVEHLSANKIPSSLPELLERAVRQGRLDEELRLWVKANVTNRGAVSVAAEPPGSLGRAANYARIYGGGAIGLAYERRGSLLVMSLRSQSVDLNKALRKISRELGVQGGGHPFAAGARVPAEKLNDFLEKLNCIAAEALSPK